MRPVKINMKSNMKKNMHMCYYPLPYYLNMYSVLVFLSKPVLDNNSYNGWESEKRPLQWSWWNEAPGAEKITWAEKRLNRKKREKRRRTDLDTY